MMASRNNYKNSLKKLRKINPSFMSEREKRSVGNYYKYLSKLEEEEVEEPELEKHKNTCKSIVREKRLAIDFNDLPEDTVYKILEFLSVNTRLAILKWKFSKKTIKNIINRVPIHTNHLTKIWKCANIANKLLESLIDWDSDVFTNLPNYSLRIFKGEAKPEMYSHWYKQNFTEIIIAAIRHYSRIYKFGQYTNKKVIEHVEQIMLNIFAHLTMMK
jgi:hypothetical protein